MSLPTTIRVIQFDQSRSVGLVDAPIPELAADEVLVRSKVVGLCRSDIELLEGHLDAQLGIDGPVVPGHEWSGEVVAIGDAISHLAVGDPVVGECVLAPNTWFGFDYPGAGAELFKAPGRLLHKLPEGIDFHSGALIEPFTIAYRGIQAAGGCNAADVVVIVGGGMVGLCALAIAAANGAETIVLEPSERRRDLAAALGASHVVDPMAETADQDMVEGLTGRPGATLVIEASGTAPGLASTLHVAGHAGRILNIGICAVDEITAPLGLIQVKDLTVLGTTGSSGVWPDALVFMRRHRIDLSRVITATYAMGDVKTAIEAANDPANVKVHIEMDQLGRSQ